VFKVRKDSKYPNFHFILLPLVEALPSINRPEVNISPVKSIYEHLQFLMELLLYQGAKFKIESNSQNQQPIYHSCECSLATVEIATWMFSRDKTTSHFDQ